MNRKEFANIARRFSFMNKTDVPFLSEWEWKCFRDYPVNFFLLTDDSTAEKLWRVVNPTEGGTEHG